jgi:hypothetical protein
MRRPYLFLLLLLLCGAISGFAPGKVTVLNPSGIRHDGQYVDDVLRESMQAQNIGKPLRAGDFPHESEETLRIAADGIEEVNKVFYDRGWTDGLPIVPPTKERVQAMLTGSDISGDFVVATLEPLGGQATIEKIAVNAIMAGCEPKHMPVLVTAVELAARDEFDLRGWGTTTNPDAALMILSGPIVKDLDINDGTNTFGRGWKSNAALSRALHLIFQNIGGSWPGVTDMSTMGQPGEFVMLFAENAVANPWGPYHTAFGLPENANILTLAAVEGYSGILGIGQSREGFLKLIASWLKGHDRPYRNTILLVIAQDTAMMLANEGWTRESLISFIKEHAKVPLSEFKEQFIDTNMAKKGVPTWVFQEKDMNRLIPKPFLDNLLVIVAGGTGEKSMLLPCWVAGSPVSAAIRLPANWKQLVGTGN